MESSSRKQITNICVFGGAKSGNNVEFENATRELGRIMVAKKMHLVYAGGNSGLMGIIARTVQEGGNQVLGIVPKTLADDAIIGKTVGEKLIVSSMSEQISEMIKHADAFIALPGGLGVMEEIFTVASWANLNIHQKPIGIFNISSFFDFLFIFLDDAKRTGFLMKSTKDIFLSARRADQLIDQLQAFEPKIDPNIVKLDWSDSDRGKKRKLDLDLNLSL